MPAPFDPAAATAAYLAVLPPEAHTKATAYTQGGHWLLLWSAFVAVAIAWAVLRSGVLVRLRERLERGGPQPWRMSVAVVFVYGLSEAVIGLPWSLYSGWWREKLWAYREFFQRLPRTLEERKRVQALRGPTASDAQYLTGKLEFAGLDHPIITQVANPVLSAYWAVAHRALQAVGFEK